jgi:ankyrin repeat protein
MSTPRILACALLMAASGCQPAPTAVQSTPSAAEVLAAVDSGDIRAVRTLVAKGANPDAAVPGDGTALILASKQGKLAMVDALLELGAGVEVPSRGDGNPLIMAAKAGHDDVVARLVEAGADPNAVVAGDETPLINAAREGHLATVEYLVEHGADVNLGVTADFGQWRSPLNQASSEAIKSYLTDHGASVGGKADGELPDKQ